MRSLPLVYALAATLDRLGWTSADLGRRLEVHANTVARWHKRGPPTVVILYLELLLRLRREVSI